MTCPSCGTENREGRKFCSECGATLALVCPSCGATNEPREKFCGECGTALGATMAPGAAAPSSNAASRSATYSGVMPRTCVARSNPAIGAPSSTNVRI